MTALLTRRKTTPEFDKRYVLRLAEIEREREEFERAKDVTFGHSTMQDLTLSPEETSIVRKKTAFLHKQDEMPDRTPSSFALNPIQVEVACTNLFNLLDPAHCASAYIVLDGDIANHCIIKKINGLKTVDQVLQKADFPLETTQELLASGIAPVMIYNFLLQNNDFRTGNIGLTEEKTLIAFDFDKALWSYPTCALFNPMNADDQYDKALFPLTLRDIQNFPDIQDATPEQWPTRDLAPYDENNPLCVRSQKLAVLLRQLKDDPLFIEEKYGCFFKFSLLCQCPTLITQALAKSIHPECNAFKIILAGLQSRAQQLQWLLLADPQFEPFIENTQTWFKAIKDEYPEFSEEIENGYGSFYNKRATKQLEISPEKILTQRAGQANLSWQGSRARTDSLLQHADPTEKKLAKAVDTLLEKYSGHTQKIELHRTTHKDAKLLKFCQNLKVACENLQTEKVAVLLADTPKTKSSFFSWFFRSKFEKSVNRLIKSDCYQKCSNTIRPATR